MQISVSGVDELKNYFRGLRETEIPKAMEVTINKTLGSAKSPKPDTVALKLKNEISKVFDRPTAWAKNSLFTDPAKASANKYSAEIKIKDEYVTGTKGTPGVKFLGPNVQGGGRGHKSHEMQMIRRGLMSSDSFIVPGPHAKIDKYGNQSRTEINQILSALGAYTAAGYNQNTASGTLKGWTYLISNDRKTVFKVKNNQVKILWYIVKAPHYKKIYNFFEVGIEEANRLLPINAAWAVEKAIKYR